MAAGAAGAAVAATPPPASDDIVGDPIGRDGLLEDLAGEMIPYTPEELIEIGKREYAWCEAEMKKASREMGFGDDWKKALEKVKNAVRAEPGEQPELIRDLARRGRGVRGEARPDHGPAARRGDLAHGDDVARAAAGEPVLHRRRGDQRVVSRPTRWRTTTS